MNNFTNYSNHTNIYHDIPAIEALYIFLIVISAYIPICLCACFCRLCNKLERSSYNRFYDGQVDEVTRVIDVDVPSGV